MAPGGSRCFQIAFFVVSHSAWPSSSSVVIASGWSYLVMKQVRAKSSRALLDSRRLQCPTPDFFARSPYMALAGAFKFSRPYTEGVADERFMACPRESPGTSHLWQDATSQATADNAHETASTHHIYGYVQVNHLGLRTCHWAQRLKPLPTTRTRQSPLKTAMGTSW